MQAEGAMLERRVCRSAHDPPTLPRPPAHHGRHAARRVGGGVRHHPRRAGRPDRHDAAARREPGRHRPAAGALRPRQVASSSNISSGCRACCAAISAPRSRCARTCCRWCSNRLPATLELVDRRAAHRARHRHAAGDPRRARARHGGRSRHRRRQRRGALHPRLPVGAGADPALRRAVAGLRDFRPRVAAARTALRHAVLSLRKHLAAALRPDQGPDQPHVHAGAWRWRCRSRRSSRNC